MVNFTQLQNAIKTYDTEREKLIKKSREVLKLSKQVIYAVHRDELKNAVTLIKQLDKTKKELEKIAKYSTKMLYEGSYKIAVQEYVEAILYYQFIKTGKLQSLQTQPEHYILGLADLPGELVRKAVFLAGKGEVAKVGKIRDIVDMIYGELLKFDFRDNEVRRKVDGIKYDLRKLEDLMLDLKLRGR